MPEELTPGSDSTQEIDVSVDTPTISEPSTPTQPSGAPPAQSDWRVEKYGPDWENSVAYWRDTERYRSNELDKAKRQLRQQRSIEQSTTTHQQPQQPTQPQEPSPYSGVETIDQFGQRIESRFKEQLDAREREANFRASMASVREKEQGDPARGIPSFSDLEQEVLIPVIEKNPQIRELVKLVFPQNAGQAFYTLGFLLKYNTLDKLEALFAGKARQELGDKIEQVSQEAVRMRGRRDGATNGKLTPADIWNMSSAEFARLEAKNTGRIP